MARAVASVQVTAVHVACGMCGARTRIDLVAEDGFTNQVLLPFGTWWMAHLAPRIVLFEIWVNGQHRQWQATG